MKKEQEYEIHFIFGKELTVNVKSQDDLDKLLAYLSSGTQVIPIAPNVYRVTSLKAVESMIASRD